MVLLWGCDRLSPPSYPSLSVSYNIQRIALSILSQRNICCAGPVISTFCKETSKMETSSRVQNSTCADDSVRLYENRERGTVGSARSRN